jgi:hypothetical protein
MTTEAVPAIGKLSLHLPSGTAFIGGFTLAGDGSPEVGGVLLADAPVEMGGTLRLNKGLDPMRRSTTRGPVVDLRVEPPGFDRHGFDWAGLTTADAATRAADFGWRTVTRREAAKVLIATGYRIPPRRDQDGTPHFHTVLWEDQVDDLTWHVREAFDGTRFTYERCVFVCRDTNA